MARDPVEIFLERVRRIPLGKGKPTAELAGVTDAILSRWKRGKVVPNPTLETIKGFAAALDVDPAYLISDDVDPRGRPVPAPTVTLDGADFSTLGLRLRAGAGPGVVNREDEDAVRLAFRKDWLRSHCGTAEMGEDCAFLVRVRGDSMEPTLRDGAVVMALRERRADHSRFRPGIFVIRDDDGLIVKRAALDGQVLVITSDNPAYAPRAVSLDGRPILDIIEGRVVWVSQELEKPSAP